MKHLNPECKNENPNSEEICPVCGYYCLGKGGMGCIDKPSFSLPESKVENNQIDYCENCKKELKWNTNFTHKHGNQYYKKTLNRVSAECCGKVYYTDKSVEDTHKNRMGRKSTQGGEKQSYERYFE